MFIEIYSVRVFRFLTKFVKNFFLFQAKADKERKTLELLKSPDVS